MYLLLAPPVYCSDNWFWSRSYWNASLRFPGQLSMFLHMHIDNPKNCFLILNYVHMVEWCHHASGEQCIHAAGLFKNIPLHLSSHHQWIQSKGCRNICTRLDLQLDWTCQEWSLMVNSSVFVRAAYLIFNFITHFYEGTWLQLQPPIMVKPGFFLFIIIWHAWTH